MKRLITITICLFPLLSLAGPGFPKKIEIYQDFGEIIQMTLEDLNYSDLSENHDLNCSRDYTGPKHFKMYSIRKENTNTITIKNSIFTYTPIVRFQVLFNQYKNCSLNLENIKKLVFSISNNRSNSAYTIEIDYKSKKVLMKDSKNRNKFFRGKLLEWY